MQKHNVITKQACLNEAKKYKNRTDFYKKNHKFYNYARINGFLDKACSHMKDPSVIHTIESCHKVALKYRSKTEFRSKANNVWVVAFRNGWHKKICSHMQPENNFSKDRKYQECVLACSKYNNKSIFRKKEPELYRRISWNKWQHLYAHMIKGHPNAVPTNKEELLRISKKFKSRSDLQRKKPGVYAYICKNKWQKMMFSHMVKKSDLVREAVSKHSVDKIQKYILKNKIKTRTGLRKKHGGMYAYLCFHKKINTVFNQLHNKGYRSQKYTVEDIQNLMLKNNVEFRNQLQIRFYPEYAFLSVHKLMNKAFSIFPHKGFSEKHERHELKHVQPKIFKFLRNLKLNVDREFLINSRSRVDFMLSKGNKKMVIEAKSWKKRWSFSRLKEQKQKYNRAGKMKYGKNFIGTYFVCLNGKNGMDLNQLKSLLKEKGFIKKSL